MNQQQAQELALHLTRQFIALRGQQSRNRESAAGLSPNLADNLKLAYQDTITQLASQMGSLLLRESSSSSSSWEQANNESAAQASNHNAFVPYPSIDEQKFLNSYLSVNSAVLGYDDMELLDLACEQIPMDRLFEEAEAMKNEYPGDGLDDIVIRRLLHWFKNDYFTWVNEPPCDTCQAKTIGIGHDAPTAQERSNGAGAVEIFKCSQTCTSITRFPRYGGMPKILFTTRRGRCGEWANCFTVCCRALGYKARFVHDTTDHVWTEVWSEHKKRWIHCDSCEAAYDQPLLYTTGWGKSLSYCVAFSNEEVVDVTRRYTVDYETIVLRRRRSIREPVLAKLLHHLSESNLTRLELNLTETQVIRQRQIMEEEELSGKKGDSRTISTNDRESGSDEWTRARGERR